MHLTTEFSLVLEEIDVGSCVLETAQCKLPPQSRKWVYELA